MFRLCFSLLRSKKSQPKEVENCGEVSAGVEAKPELQSTFLKDQSDFNFFFAPGVRLAYAHVRPMCASCAPGLAQMVICASAWCLKTGGQSR